ncbi:hypothetical protein [Gynuella sunshinyii]|uniref:hypothetical protein n=1 Tax=Gynuella sunshinyii TaxID=1445505 RepID=UPI0005CC5C6D|nr:hypothetical protein [Gynuella sunshinyii]
MIKSNDVIKALYLLFVLFLSGCKVGLESPIGGDQFSPSQYILGKWKSIDSKDEFTLASVDRDSSLITFSDSDFSQVPIDFYKVGARKFAVISSLGVSQVANEEMFYVYFHYTLENGILSLYGLNYDLLLHDGKISFSRFSCQVHEELGNASNNNCSIFNSKGLENIGEVFMDKGGDRYFVPLGKFSK